MKSIFIFLSLLLVTINVRAQESEAKCHCGTYKYDYAMPGNSTNHYRLIDGVADAALIRDTERTIDRKYIFTEVQMEWPGKQAGYIPALDQIADDEESICVKGKVSDVKLTANAAGLSEKLTYFEYIENVYAANSKCEGEPVSIHLSLVKKAELPK